MKLSHLRVRNYRGLRDISIPLSPFVCITGENNAGKSSVLQALSLFLSGSTLKPTDYFETDEEIVIEVEVSEVSDGDLTLLAEEHRERTRSILSGDSLTLVRRYGTDGKGQLGHYAMLPRDPRFRSDNIDKLLTKKSGKQITEAVVGEFPELEDEAAGLKSQVAAKDLINAFSDRVPQEDRELQFCPLQTGIGNSILPMLPERIYIPAVKDLSDDTKTAESSSFGKILSIVMKSIEPLLAEEVDLFDKLSKKLTRVLGADGKVSDDRLPVIREIEQSIQRFVQESFSRVKLEIEIPPPELKSVLSTARILADDGVRGPLELKGDGLRRAVVFSILRAYVELSRSTGAEVAEGAEPGEDKQPVERGYLLLFEEPELFLHPEAQKILFDALGIFSERHQVLVTTHSPLFLAPKTVATFVRLSKSDDKGVAKPFSKALSVNLADVKPRDQFQIVCYENNNAAFFSKRVVLVEGDSDYIAFPHIAATLNSEWNCRAHSVVFVRVGGKGSIARYREFFSLFEIPIFVIADLDTLVDGFDKLDPSETVKTIRDDLLRAVDAEIERSGAAAIPKTDDIKSAQGKSDIRSLWEAVREAKKEFDSDPSTFDVLDTAMRDFFAWERKNLRKDVLAAATCAEVKRLKLALIWELRKAGAFILERGALDDYYPADLPGGNTDKPKRAQNFIDAHDTLEKVLPLSSEQTCPDTDAVATEFEFIFSRIFGTL